MGDGDDGAGVLLEVLLQPEHALGVEVVGGLVEQQEVGLLQEQLAQRDAALLTTGEHGDIGVRRRAAQRIHRLLELGVEVPRVEVVDLLLQRAHLGEELVVVGVGVGELGGDLVEAVDLRLGGRDALHHVVPDVLGLVEAGLLREHAHGVAGRQERVAVGRLVDPGHDLEQGGLACAVGADNADLGAREERERHVVEDDLVAVSLTSLTQGVDELRHEARAYEATAQSAASGVDPTGLRQPTTTTGCPLHSEAARFSPNCRQADTLR